MKLPYPIIRRFRALAIRTMRRQPDFIIGDPDRPYMLRWWVIPRNRLFNIYLHLFRRSDDDRALHDHPWLSCSIILERGYVEELPGNVRIRRDPGTVTFRRAQQAHRVDLHRIGESELTATTLFITGPRIRNWGFHCPNGWVPWQDFVSKGNAGEIGPGCGQ